MTGPISDITGAFRGHGWKYGYCGYRTEKGGERASELCPGKAAAGADLYKKRTAREAGRWLESSLEDDRDNEDSMKWLRLLQEDGQGRKGLKKADRPSNRKKTDKKISAGFLKSAAVWMAAGAAAAAAAGFMFVPVLSGQMKHVMDAQVLNTAAYYQKRIFKSTH